MKTDLDRLFPTKRGDGGQGEKKPLACNPVASLSNPFGGDANLLSDNDLAAGIPCQPHFGKVCQTRKVDGQPPKTGDSESSLFNGPVAPSAPVEPVAKQPAPAAEPTPAVVKPTESTATGELPPGWPSEVPVPDWWAEFLAVKGNIELLAARRQKCGDPGCGFPVAVEWEAPGYPRQWSCPKCGRTAAAGQLSGF